MTVRHATDPASATWPARALRGPRARLSQKPGGAGDDTKWERRYATVTQAADIAVISACVTIGVLLGAGMPDEFAFLARVGSGALAWALLVACLFVGRAWEPRVLGHGPTELRRLSKAFATAAIIVGIIGLAFEISSVRPWVFIIVPGCWALCMTLRFALRKVLHHARTVGQCQLPVLAVGTTAAVSDLIHRTRRDMHVGWRVDGVCTSTGFGPDGLGTTIEGVPVLGDLDSVATVVREGGFRVVAMSPAPGWGPGRLHQLSWDLEDTPAVIAVDPGLMEIAGPRLHITPIDGMPLLQLTQPRFSGSAWLIKGILDKIGAALLLFLLLPVLLAVSLAVRRDGGPVFYRQERVGLAGRTFRMVKFRSMCVDADQQSDVLAAAHDGAGPMFKNRVDPRITPVGAFLRRYSMDELPQLLNVLGGSMSLIGPRPPLQAEVRSYGPDAERRLLVKPGMTGLWQVSGRSDLSWEETVRLDLRYVENWSITLDALILWKTLGAVVRGRGAY